MRILLLTRYGQAGASSRIRCYQYLPFFRDAGVQVRVAPLLDDAYLRGLYAGAARNWTTILTAYCRRLAALLSCRDFDLLWIEYELFPWLPSWFERALAASGAPYIVEYDDAIFHRYDAHPSRVVRAVLGRKIHAVMRRAAAVVAGNEYLAERARSAGASRIELIPSVIDLCRYSLDDRRTSTVCTIGWIGSPTSAKYLTAIDSVLRSLHRGGGVRFALVGVRENPLPGLPVEITEWSESTEEEAIRRFDIGIMPLTDGPWERGKCGYKLVQYMGCGKPVVASAVAANLTIVEHGRTGYLATDDESWLKALTALSNDRALARRMGEAGRRRVEAEYALQVTAPRWLRLIREVAGAGRDAPRAGRTDRI